MGFFSGLFTNKKKENKSTLMPIKKETSTQVKTVCTSNLNKIGEISRKLKTYTQTADIGLKLEKLVNQKGDKDQILTLLSELKEVIDTQIRKSYEKKEINDMHSDINVLKVTSFSAQFNGFENFYKDFENLEKEYIFLEKFNKKVTALFDEIEIDELSTKYKDLYNKFNEAKDKAILLKEEQDTLTKEIVKYSSTINEYKEKYKLTVDWEGKKPIMIALGKKLGENRESLVEKEGKLNDDIKEIYELYKDCKVKFLNNSDYFIGRLEENTETETREETQRELKNIYIEFLKESEKIV